MPAIAPFGNGDLLDESVAGGVVSDVGNANAVLTEVEEGSSVVDADSD